MLCLDTYCCHQGCYCYNKELLHNLSFLILIIDFYYLELLVVFQFQSVV